MDIRGEYTTDAGEGGIYVGMPGPYSGDGWEYAAQADAPPPPTCGRHPRAFPAGQEYPNKAAGTRNWYPANGSGPPAAAPAGQDWYPADPRPLSFRGDVSNALAHYVPPAIVGRETMQSSPMLSSQRMFILIVVLVAVAVILCEIRRVESSILNALQPKAFGSATQ